MFHYERNRKYLFLFFLSPRKVNSFEMSYLHVLAFTVLFLFPYFFLLFCDNQQKKQGCILKEHFREKTINKFLLPTCCFPLYNTTNSLFINILTKCHNSRILFRSPVKPSHISLKKSIHVRKLPLCLLLMVRLCINISTEHL